MVVDQKEISRRGREGESDTDKLRERKAFNERKKRKRRRRRSSVYVCMWGSDSRL